MEVIRGLVMDDGRPPCVTAAVTRPFIVNKASDLSRLCSQQIYGHDAAYADEIQPNNEVRPV